MLCQRLLPGNTLEKSNDPGNLVVISRIRLGVLLASGVGLSHIYHLLLRLTIYRQCKMEQILKSIPIYINSLVRTHAFDDNRLTVRYLEVFFRAKRKLHHYGYFLSVIKLSTDHVEEVFLKILEGTDIHGYGSTNSTYK